MASGQRTLTNQTYTDKQLNSASYWVRDSDCTTSTLSEPQCPHLQMGQRIAFYKTAFRRD